MLTASLWGFSSTLPFDVYINTLVITDSPKISGFCTRTACHFLSQLSHSIVPFSAVLAICCLVMISVLSVNETFAEHPGDYLWQSETVYYLAAAYIACEHARYS